MTSNICQEQIVDEKYDEIFESVISNPDLDFYQSSYARNSKKKSSRKRPDSEKEHLNIHLAKKKRKETTKDRLLEKNEFYSNTEFGIWIQCTKCNKWRKSMEYEEEHQVPKDWCCSMNMTGIKNCDDPEDTEEVEFSETDFIPGSIVWAKLDGFPWWPGMVEDDPDIEEYYWFDGNGKMHYNITFLDDDVTHAWVNSSFVQSYLKPLPRNHRLKRKYKNAHLVEEAKEKANAAIKMSIKERLQIFSFANRFTGKWSRAIDFDDDEESENITMLIKEIYDIDSLMSSDSENEKNSLAAIQQNITHKKNYKENDLSKGKKKKIDVDSYKKGNFDEGLENIILNEEYFTTNKNAKEKSVIVDSKKESSAVEKVIRNTPSDDRSLKRDKNEQQILHSLKTEKKNISTKLKSDAENKIQKMPKLKIEGSNKEIKKKSSLLEKHKKKGNLEKTDSVVAQEKKVVPKKFSKMMRKTSFTPPVRNETEYHKNEVNNKAFSNQMNINRKNVITHKNLSTNIKDCLGNTVNELISNEDESKSEKSAEPDKESDEGKEKQATNEENQNVHLSNKIDGEIQIKTKVSPKKENRELICISDEEPIGTALPEEKISSKKVLEKAANQSKTNKKISKKITAKSNTCDNNKYQKDKIAKKENEVIKVLEKNIKNSTVNTPTLNTYNEENNLDFKTNSDSENLDTEKGIIEKNQKYSEKAKNKILDMKDKRKKNTNVNKKIENHFKESKQNKKTCNKITAVMRITKTQPYCPIKQNKQIMEVPKTKTSQKPAVMEIEDNISRENYAQNDGALKKYKGVGNKSNSLSDSKIKERSELSTKSSSLNCESEISSYSLCLNNLNEEPSEDEDSDPFEAN